MKPSGAIYQGAEGRRYLGIYAYNHDVLALLPKEFRSAQRVAAVSYSKGGKKGAVDIFLLNDNLPPIPNVARIKKTFSYENGEFLIKHDDGRLASLPKLPTVRTNLDYDIQAQMVSSLPIEAREEVLASVRADIAYHCGEDKSKELRAGSRLDLVERIIPVTELEKITPDRVLRGGKAEFIPQCVLEANIDYMDGCITSWIPGPEASFDGKFFRDYFQFIPGDCEYCYAKKNHRTFPKSIYNFDQQRVLEELKGGARLLFGSEEPHGKPIEILRFGKRTDPWTPWTENDLLGTLEAMTHTGTKGVITTKFLPYNSKFVDLLKKTKSAVLFSTGGNENVELGPAEWGRTNEFRIEQAIKYREQKVHSALFYLMNPFFAPTEEDKKRIELAEKHGVPIQFIPTRFYDRGAAQKIISPLVDAEHKDAPMWKVLQEYEDPQQTKFAGKDYPFAGSYEANESGRILMPKLDQMHPFWAERIGKNTSGKFRMCAHDNNTTYCGGCFTKPGTISPTEHELVKITKRSKYSKNRDKQRRKDKLQLPILGLK